MQPELTVNYSVGTVFNGGGIGYTAYNAVLASFRRGWLKRLYVSAAQPSEIPNSLISTMGLTGSILRRLPRYFGSTGYEWHDDAYDQFVAANLQPSSIFHGWNQHTLQSLKKARDLGAKRVLERASSHLLTAKTILEEEYQRFGVGQPVINPKSLAKGLQEFEETDYVLVPSQFAYDSFISQQYPQEKLRLIPFGVDLEKFKPLSKVPKEKLTILFAGQVSLRKGVPYLLEAWANCRDINAHLVLAGQVQPDMAAYLSGHPLPDSVTIGFISDIKTAYAQADIFVFPSLEEGMALVTLEAMAAGLPIITTPNSGSVVTHEKEGLIVPVKDAAALTEALQRLGRDEPYRLKLAAAARTTAESYSWDTYRDKLAYFYQSIAH